MPKAAALAALLPLAATALASSSPGPKPAAVEPTVSSIASDYPKFRLITPQPVFVDMRLAVMCAPPSKAQVDSTRTQYGPHANAAIKVYMNDLAAEAFSAGGKAYPVGAVVVKEKQFMSTRGAADSPSTDPSHGVGGMVKRAAGFDAAHGDWEYFYFEDPAHIESGAISTCTGCHASAKATDYVFGSWQKSPGAPDH